MIHPTAIIDADARLHPSVSVGPYAIIGAGVELDEGTQVDAHVVLRGPMRMGRNNRVFPFACLGEISQDKSADYAEDTRVEIGDGNTIREYVTIQRGTLKDQRVTRLGDDNWLMANVHIAHDCQVGSHTVFANGCTLAGHVTVGDWVILGGYTLVHQFVQLGEHCFTGGGSTVHRDVLPYVMAEGRPTHARGINKRGLQRRGFTREDMDDIEDLYRLIYRSGKVMAEVKRELAERSATSVYAQRLLAVIEKSKRALQR